MKYLFIPIALVLFLGCSHKRSTSINTEDYSFQLIASGNYSVLELDSLTGFRHSSFRSDLDQNGVEYISFINKLTNSIYIYSADNSHLISAQKLSIDGPNGVGSLSAGSHLVHTLDSIFIYNPNHGNLYLVNSEGTIIDRHRIMQYDDDTPIMPEPIGLSKIIKVESKLYFPSTFKRRLYEYNIPSVIVFDFKNVSLEAKYQYPKKYSEAHWGSTFKYLPSIAYSNELDELVISYPIKKSMTSYTLLSGKRQEFSMASDFINDFDPFSPDLGDAFNNTNEYFQRLDIYSMSNSDYSGILHDKYRKVFYRISYIRPNEETVRSGKTIPNFISIVVFDHTFNKVAESRFDAEKYSAGMIIVVKDGLLMARKDLYDNNEDALQLEQILLK